MEESENERESKLDHVHDERKGILRRKHDYSNGKNIQM